MRITVPLLSLFTLLAIVASTRADGDPLRADCDPPKAFSEIRSFVSTGIDPLKEAYLRTNSFELDRLSADLAAIENEVDPPKRRKTITFLVRGNTERQRLSPLGRFDGNETNPLNGGWEGDRLLLKTPEVYRADGPPVSGVNALNLALSDVRKLSTSELIEKLKEGLRSDAWAERRIAKLEDPEAFLTLTAAFYKITAEDDPAGIARAQADAGKHLTTAQKIQIAQWIGSAANWRYDHSRANGGRVPAPSPSSEPQLREIHRRTIPPEATSKTSVDKTSSGSVETSPSPSPWS